MVDRLEHRMNALEQRMDLIEREYASYEGKVLRAIGDLATNDKDQNKLIDALQKDVKSILELKDDMRGMLELKDDMKGVLDEIKPILEMKDDIKETLKMKMSLEANFKLLRLLAVAAPAAWLFGQWLLSHVRM